MMEENSLEDDHSTNTAPLLPKKDKYSHYKGLLWLVVADCFLFTNFFITKIMSENGGMPVLQNLCIRGVVQVFFNFALAWYMGYPLSVAPKYHNIMLWRAVSGGFSVMLLYYSLGLMPQSLVMIILWTLPFIVAIGAALFLDEHITLKEVAVIMVGFVGIVMVTKPSFLFPVEGDQVQVADILLVFPLIAAIAGAVSVLLIRKTKEEVHHVIPVIYFGIGIMVFAPVAAILQTTDQEFTWRGLMVSILSSISASLGQVCWSRGLQLERAAIASAMGLFQVFLTFLSDYFYFGITKDSTQLAGASLLVLAVVGIAYSKSHKEIKK